MFVFGVSSQSSLLYPLWGPAVIPRILKGPSGSKSSSQTSPNTYNAVADLPFSRETKPQCILNYPDSLKQVYNSQPRCIRTGCNAFCICFTTC